MLSRHNLPAFFSLANVIRLLFLLLALLVILVWFPLAGFLSFATSIVVVAMFALILSIIEVPEWLYDQNSLLVLHSLRRWLLFRTAPSRQDWLL